MINSSNKNTRSGATIDTTAASLNTTRSSFIYRATKLYNLLPDNIKKEMNTVNYKQKMREWVKINIPIKP